MAVFSSIISAILALKEIFVLLYKLYGTVKEVTRQNNENSTIDANHKGDTIGVEQGLGNPDAGKPSGIGEIRDRQP